MFVRDLIHPTVALDDDSALDSALDVAAAAANDRIVESGEPGTGQEDLAEGAQAVPEAPAGDPAPDRPGRVPSDYERELRAENAKYRERFEPFEKAFGELDDQARADLLEAGPGLGADLITLAKAAKGLVPQDRAYIADVMASIPTDPAGAAEKLSKAAEILRGGDQQAAEPDEDLDPDDFATIGGVEQMLERREAEAAKAAQAREDRATIRDEMKQLGYDLDSKDPLESSRVSALLKAAEFAPDGDLRAAIQAGHKVLDGWEQKIRDEYVESKRKDGDRPAPPGGSGSAPSAERTLETLEDADAAMNARLDGAGIPKRQRQ